jgi:hypothetical protein
MAKKNSNATVESVLGRCGVPTAKTINLYKRCNGALDMVHGDIELAVENMAGPGVFGARKNLKTSSIRYYVSSVNRLSATEKSRLKNMSSDVIIKRIAQLKK